MLSKLLGGSLVDTVGKVIDSVHTSEEEKGQIKIKLQQLENEINSHVNFDCVYKPDYRQDIADTWPISINDDDARKDWGWEPKFDISKMTEEMITNLRRLNE